METSAVVKTGRGTVVLDVAELLRGEVRVTSDEDRCGGCRARASKSWSFSGKFGGRPLVVKCDSCACAFTITY